MLAIHVLAAATVVLFNEDDSVSPLILFSPIKQRSNSFSLYQLCKVGFWIAGSRHTQPLQFVAIHTQLVFARHCSVLNHAIRCLREYVRSALFY